MTLLDIVQRILASLGSHRVNSIGDNDEALDVAEIVRSVYEDITTATEFQENWSLFELQASGDLDRPLIMTRPNNVRRIEWIKYDAASTENPESNYKLIEYFEPLKYFEMMHAITDTDSNVVKFVHQIGDNTIDIVGWNDRPPAKYTTYDHKTFIFDAYDATMDGTLQNDKTLCYGTILPRAFELENDWEPDLTPEHTQILFQEAKALAWAEIKQAQNAKAEKSARKLWVGSQRHFDTVETENYGRKR